MRDGGKVVVGMDVCENVGRTTKQKQQESPSEESPLYVPASCTPSPIP
jgi:hypothetical protein